MIRFIYNLLFPVVFVFFIPGIIIKQIRRSGWKKTFSERFAIFSAERKKELADYQGATWIHSVSVGETQIALDLIAKWKKLRPEHKFVLSTTTTTGQQLARDKMNGMAAVIFCPIDFFWFVKKTFNLIKPAQLVILETEIWPNMLFEAKKRGIGTFLINARMSDKSSRGYRRARVFFAPVLNCFNKICVQSEMDMKRFLSVAPSADVVVTGNLKFDRSVPENLPAIDLSEYFGTGDFQIVLASCTHPGEEKLVADTFLKLKKDFNDARLVIVPRHAERGPAIVEELNDSGISFCRRTQGMNGSDYVDCLLADTTGEMFGFINKADIVIMGKSMAGHDEGHNLIEPALFAKPIVTGSVLTNFRFVLDVLKADNALITISSDAELEPALRKLLGEPALRESLGQAAEQAIARHRGALEKTIKILEA